MGPGRLLKYLIFSAWRRSDLCQSRAKTFTYFPNIYLVNKDRQIFHINVEFTCVAVVLIKGLKVKRPCRSSSKSSPAALNICSSGVPGNILKDT